MLESTGATEDEALRRHRAKIEYQRHNWQRDE
jgi:hypothetical protein